MKAIKEHPNQQHCPACNSYVKHSTRYPNYACSKCIGKAIDEHGRRVVFYNTTDDGHGCQGRLVETNELITSDFCYIKGIRFKAEEAYMGGIVLLSAVDNKPKRKRRAQKTKPNHA
jgi:hypothetical protein